MHKFLTKNGSQYILLIISLLIKGKYLLVDYKFYFIACLTRLGDFPLKSGYRSVKVAHDEDCNVFFPQPTKNLFINVTWQSTLYLKHT